MSKYQDPQVVGPANGEARGVSNDMPNRGTSSGFVHRGEPYGADTGPNATNRMGGFHAGSDSAFDNCPKEPGTLTGSNHSPGEGVQRGLGGAAKADPAADVTPDNPN